MKIIRQCLSSPLIVLIKNFSICLFIIIFLQNDTQYMKCGINSVRYDATVFSNTAVCHNVIVSYY
jgi:hypothetical protein